MLSTMLVKSVTIWPKKFMYFSTDVPKVFLAFITLSEIEIENLTNVIEGIRYQVEENEIKQMLIY